VFFRSTHDLFGRDLPESADAERVAVDAAFLGRADRAALRAQVGKGIAAVTVPERSTSGM
jgi:adenosine deaminase